VDIKSNQNQIKLYLSHAPNTTGVDRNGKCLLIQALNQQCSPRNRVKKMSPCVPGNVTKIFPQIDVPLRVGRHSLWATSPYFSLSVAAGIFFWN
jgi:hypothetical protein